jgi:protein-S-isoprenylcysteine O-methyltransferase Ste14
MNIKLIITVSFSIIYGLFEFFMSKRQRGERTIAKSGDKMSIWAIVISISAGYWLSFIIGSTRIGRVYPWNTFFAIGVILVFIGLIIRVKSILTLKKQFTYTVTKVEDHELIEKGLYKIIRHPGYLGQLIIFTGIAASLSNWLSIILMFVPVFIGYSYRIRVEEKFMIEQMGQKYIEYQKRTRKLIPGIF